MGRGGEVGYKRSNTRRIKGSDDSDEDYMVGEDEGGFNDDTDEYCSSFVGDVSEESLGGFEEDEEEEKVRKVVRSKAKMGLKGRRKNGVKMLRKRKRVSYDDDDDFEKEEVERKVRPKAKMGFPGKRKNGVKMLRNRKRVSDDDDDDDDDDYEEEEEEEEEDYDDDGEEVRRVVRSKAKMDFSGRKKNGVKMSWKRKRVSYDDDDEEEEEEDYDDDDDEEFMLDENEYVDEEEELSVNKKSKKAGRPPLRKKGSVKTRRRKQNSKVLKKPVGKKQKKSRGLRRKASCDDDGEFVDKNTVVRERSKKNAGRRKRRFVAQSDSDFVLSGSSDFDFTISDEEREQMIEASEFCRSLTTSLRSSSLSKRLQEDGASCQQRKPMGRKGKEKVVDLRNEVGKQVCGICLSEEGIRTVRGTLNSCSHYFCFACIMEWSKVESRCPLCKQRFITISKPAKSNTGFDLRTVVVQIPERDQVYQPSEEELRGYLDPYENVICTECHQGGDDGLMLLCDLCDSPAHTYCVGLGREVPEGNWYCEGCRPSALGSLNLQVQDPSPNQRVTNNLSSRPSPIDIGEGLEPTSMSVPDAPFTQGIGILLSPRYPVGGVQAASPVSGGGASTLSGRRRIHRQIHHLLSNNRMGQMAGGTDGIAAANSGSDFFNSQIDRGRETTFQHSRTLEMGTMQYNFLEERLPDNPSPSVSARLNHLRRQGVQDTTTAPTDGTAHGMRWAALAGISGTNPISGYDQQLQPCSSRSSTGSDACVSPCTYRDGSHSNVAKGQLRSMVRSHLKILSRDMELGHSIFNDIESCSTHTILAVCGLEHRKSKVYPVQPPSICYHVEIMAVGQSLMKGCCSSCFDCFVRDAVKKIMNTKLPRWLGFRD